MTTETFALRLERIFEAPREAVFRAFTDRALRHAWLRPADDWSVLVTEIDPRIGGAYRDVFRSPEGQEFTESGVFEELSAPERLVYGCRFEGEGVLEPEMRVTIDLQDVGGRKTRLALEQSGYRERANRDAQEQGWPAFLDQLAKQLERS